MDKNNIFAFVGGIIVGAVAGGTTVYFISKKKTEARIDELIKKYEVNDTQKEAEKKIDIPDEYKRQGSTSNKIDAESSGAEPDRYLTDEEKQKIKEKLQKNNNKTIEYAKMYTSPVVTIDESSNDISSDSDEDELEEDDDDDDDDEEELIEQETVNIFDVATNRSKGRDPRIISEDAAEDLPSIYSRCTLFVYDDGFVSDEEDNIIENPSMLLGGCLDKYNFLDSNENCIFVQNYNLHTVYEVQKAHENYEKD